MFPLSFPQQRIWFLDQLMPGTAAFHLNFAPRLDLGNVTVLERALNEIVRRHESLRTTFQSVDGDLRQIVTPYTKIPVRVIDLTRHPEPVREERIVRLATATRTPS